MKNPDQLIPDGEPPAPGDRGRTATEETDRAHEQGDVAEPDAPTAEEENEGMSTVLSADPVLGVQDDAREE